MAWAPGPGALGGDGGKRPNFKDQDLVREAWSRRGDATARRYEIWRCEFEKFVCLQQRWCELPEAEAQEERESECSTKEDQPPAPRRSVALGSLAKFAPEKVALRREDA